MIKLGGLIEEVDGGELFKLDSKSDLYDLLEELDGDELEPHSPYDLFEELDGNELVKLDGLLEKFDMDEFVKLDDLLEEVDGDELEPHPPRTIYQTSHSRTLQELTNDQYYEADMTGGIFPGPPLNFLFCSWDMVYDD
ncbi:hypothetical protein AGMMS49990_10260 [Endomicrobiia bacterium]|nr:hypothetical protein AGMMS49990_10260 [Endomicrobiia bacterium]